jgi:hypothetical protein
MGRNALNVVRGPAGTRTSHLTKVEATIQSNDSPLWLWVPAFAGTTDRRELQNKPAQIGVLGEIADVLLDIVGIDLDGLAMAVGGGKGNLVEHALHHGL